MEYDLEHVKSLEMDHENRIIIVELASGEKKTFTEDEIQKVTLKATGWLEDDKAYFNDARCSIDKVNKEIVCGD